MFTLLAEWQGQYSGTDNSPIIFFLNCGSLNYVLGGKDVGTDIVYTI